MIVVDEIQGLTSGVAVTCTFSAPAAGHWYIMLRGFAAYSGVELVATVQ